MQLATSADIFYHLAKKSNLDTQRVLCGDLDIKFIRID